MDIRTRFFECGATEDPVDMTKPLAGDYHALKDERFVAWIEFRRAICKNRPDDVFPLLKLDPEGVLDWTSGRIFTCIDDAIFHCGFRVEETVVETCYLLLQDGSLLPRCKIPQDTRLIINVRDGAQVALVDNVVKVSCGQGLQRWVYNRRGTSAFQEAVYSLMRA